MNRQGVVYRCFSALGVLLYIGRTQDISGRLRDHRRVQPWWPEVAHIDLAFYDDDREADREERRAILAENPRHNIIRHPFTPRLPVPRFWTLIPDDLADRIEVSARKRSRTRPQSPGRDEELAAAVYEALMLGCQPGIVAQAAGLVYHQAKSLVAKHQARHPELEPIPPWCPRATVAA